MKPTVKILSLLSVISLTLVPIYCDTNGYIYTGPWREVPTPGGEGHLNSCYFNSPNDGWAVGHDGTGQGKMIFINWNGVDWEEYEYPGWFDAYGTVNRINMSDVFFTSPDDGWAVGFVGFENDDYYGFVLRHDGNDWYLFEKEVSFYKIYGIAENDVWFLTGSYDSDLYHWDGTEFEYYNLYPGNYGLRAMAFGSATDGLAVGKYKVIYHWDGESWEQIYYGLGGELDGVAYNTPSTAWIVGNYPYNIFKWDNGELTWEHHKNCWYEDVHFSSPDEGWMYGVEATEEYPEGHGFTWHWDGVGWTRVDIPEDMRGWDIFSIDYDNAWVVGEHYAYTPYCSSWRYISN